MKKPDGLARLVQALKMARELKRRRMTRVKCQRVGRKGCVFAGVPRGKMK